MSHNQGGYLSVPSFDGPSDTRSNTSHRSGGSHSRHASQPSGSHVSASHHGSQAPGSHPPSNAGAASGSVGSRPPSNAGASPRPQGYPEPLGYDPGRERKFGDDFNKNVDLPPEAYVEGKLDTPFARRPGFGSQGKKVGVQVNQFRVLNVPLQDVVQYDISISPDTAKPAFIKKVWHTPTVQAGLKKDPNYGVMPHSWLFDGRKLAWSMNNFPRLKIKVDMDKEQGRAPRPGRNNTFVVLITRSTTIRLSSLKAYLEGKMEWDAHVLECMNFFDHVIRQWPSQHLLAIKRNFYDTEKAKPFPLSEPHRIIEGIKGIYAAIRMNSSMLNGGLGLGINVDVTNTVFWRGDINMAEFVRNYIWSLKREWDGMPWPQVYQGMKPVPFDDRSGRKVPGMSEMFRCLRRLFKVTFTVKHRGKSNDEKVYTIKNFVWEPEKFGREGANARNYKFTRNGEETTVERYFKEQYGVRLEHWQMPLIQTTRAGVFPMECVLMNRFQRYNFKLEPDQTARMIKFAVTRPPQRSQAIMENVKALKWVEDPYLREFGIKIKPVMETVGARVIANPKVQFGKKTADPGLRGRWDLRGQVFAGPNPRPLKAWAIIVVNACVDQPTTQRFASAFVTSYKGLGGNIATPQPQCFPLNITRSAATADEIEKFYKSVGNQYQAPPDLFFFILPDKSQVVYERLKRNMDIRLAMVSQMIQSSHAMKAQPQYCANVAMKVNAKLGGFTSKLVGANFFPAPTMMIGVDVSHGSPGQSAGSPPIPSMAAMTISMNRDATRYAAVCETNGQRVEILAPARIREMFPGAVRRWCAENKCAPQHVFYFRDGVAEGQFAQVMRYEVEEVRKIIEDIGRNKIKLTVIVATKRHHIRFFPTGPDGGDNNKNPYPGMVIEHEITHPFHYDFYLCSHVAIQGTARPVHYHVLHDEVGMPIDKFQQMIYHQCYQYMRSTTPVSIHPAIYYAHLAAARARAHEAVDISERDPMLRLERINRPLAKYDNSDTTSNQRQEEVPSLLPIGGLENKAHPRNIEFFKGTMWYI